MFVKPRRDTLSTANIPRIQSVGGCEVQVFDCSRMKEGKEGEVVGSLCDGCVSGGGVKST